MEKVLKHKSPADSGMFEEVEEWGCSLACSRQSLYCPSCRRAERSWWPWWGWGGSWRRGWRGWPGPRWWRGWGGAWWRRSCRGGWEAASSPVPWQLEPCKMFQGCPLTARVGMEETHVWHYYSPVRCPIWAHGLLFYNSCIYVGYCDVVVLLCTLLCCSSSWCHVCPCLAFVLFSLYVSQLFCCISIVHTRTWLSMFFL